MSVTANVISTPLSSETTYWLRGGAIGALVFAFFGAMDAFWALSFVRDEPQIWSIAIWIVAVTLGIWSVAQRALLQRLSVTAANRSIARPHLWHYAFWFGVVVVIEVISINLGRPLLIHFHRLDLFPQWVELVVGLHFLPLARLFRVSPFYATGVALISVALGSLLIPVGSPRAIIALGAASLCLWPTAVIILLQDAAYVRPSKTITV